MTNDLSPLLLVYPLYLVIEDCYVPYVAAPLLRALRGLDDESARVSVKLWALEAEEGLSESRN